MLLISNNQNKMYIKSLPITHYNYTIVLKMKQLFTLTICDYGRQTISIYQLMTEMATRWIPHKGINRVHLHVLIFHTKNI